MRLLRGNLFLIIFIIFTWKNITLCTLFILLTLHYDIFPALLHAVPLHSFAAGLLSTKIYKKGWTNFTTRKDSARLRRFSMRQYVIT
nr:MAG TPA: hypothetical protein [Caudoviricetes sp.]